MTGPQKDEAMYLLLVASRESPPSAEWRERYARLQDSLISGNRQGGRFTCAHNWVNGRRCEDCGKFDRQYDQDYARNDDGSYMTPEQADRGWAVQ